MAQNGSMAMTDLPACLACLGTCDCAAAHCIVLPQDPIAELPAVLEYRLATAPGISKVNSSANTACGRIDGREPSCADTGRMLSAEWPLGRQPRASLHGSWFSLLFL